MPLDLLTFVFTFLGLRGDYLILDGTSWRSGEAKFHFLTLCVVYQGVAVPIFWVNLQKIGHSSTEERIGLIKEALHRFDLSYSVLIADREYIGTKWFKYLADNETVRRSDRFHNQAQKWNVQRCGGPISRPKLRAITRQG